MIRLEVQDYCQECEHFSADVENAISGFSGYSIFRTDTIIRCERRQLCARLQKEFERMQKEKENESISE